MAATYAAYFVLRGLATYFHITYRWACTVNQANASDWESSLCNEVCQHGLEELSVLAK